MPQVMMRQEEAQITDAQVEVPDACGLPLSLVDDFLAEAMPEAKLKLIREHQGGDGW